MWAMAELANAPTFYLCKFMHALRKSLLFALCRSKWVLIREREGCFVPLANMVAQCSFVFPKLWRIKLSIHCSLHNTVNSMDIQINYYMDFLYPWSSSIETGISSWRSLVWALCEFLLRTWSLSATSCLQSYKGLSCPYTWKGAVQHS